MGQTLDQMHITYFIVGHGADVGVWMTQVLQ